MKKYILIYKVNFSFLNYKNYIFELYKYNKIFNTYIKEVTNKIEKFSNLLYYKEEIWYFRKQKDK